MGQKRRDAVGGSELVKCGYIGRIDGLGLAAARIAREELERVPVDGAASWAIFRYPLALDKWQPIVNTDIPFDELIRRWPVYANEPHRRALSRKPVASTTRGRDVGTAMRVATSSPSPARQSEVQIWARISSC